jgi:hypothetical protein
MTFIIQSRSEKKFGKLYLSQRDCEGAVEEKEAYKENDYDEII